MEGGAGGDQTLQEKDPNERIFALSPSKPSIQCIAGLKTTSGDLHMAGAE